VWGNRHGQEEGAFSTGRSQLGEGGGRQLVIYNLEDGRLNGYSEDGRGLKWAREDRDGRSQAESLSVTPVRETTLNDGKERDP